MQQIDIFEQIDGPSVRNDRINPFIPEIERKINETSVSIRIGVSRNRGGGTLLGLFSLPRNILHNRYISQLPFTMINQFSFSEEGGRVRPLPVVISRTTDRHVDLAASEKVSVSETIARRRVYFPTIVSARLGFAYD